MSKVKVRAKKISAGRKSLYLDYYPPIAHPVTGKQTRREYLKLYVYEKPKAQLDKIHNKETITLAESIRAKRQLQIQSGQYGFLNKAELSLTLVEYYKNQAQKRIGSNKANWQSSLYYLENFFDKNLRLCDLNATLCNSYRQYILSAKSKRSKSNLISHNSAVSYFNKLKATLKQAYKEGLISRNINVQVDSITPLDTRKEYLTLEELKAMHTTECKLPLMKKAALFSALTGLRFSDIAKLQWSEVRFSKAEGYYIQFMQQKTKSEEVLPISTDAYELIEGCSSDANLVFEGLSYSAHNNKILKDWVKSAGITKDISFHCFRHTYATLQLSLGTDIYTVSKLLGHKDLKATQVYAKVVDKKKQEAVNRIKIK